jgi:flagellar biosynthesis GTPase FlhF
MEGGVKMQTKKRAKPVKFGKDTKEKIKKASTEEKTEEKDLEKPQEEQAAKEESEEKIELKDAEKGAEESASSKIDEEDLKEEEDDASEQEEEQEKEEKREEEPEATDEISDEEDREEDFGEDEVFGRPPDEFDKRKGSFGYFIKVTLFTFILGLILFAGGYYLFSNKENLLSTINKPEPSPTETQAVVTPTEEPVDLSEFSIRVLNGTETSGLAADLREELESAGFRVVSVGNADADDFEQTEIASVAKVNKAFLEKLKEELGKKYSVGDVVSLSTAAADVVITIGSRSAE